MARLFKTCARCGYENYVDAYACAKCCSSIMTMPASRQSVDWVAWSVPFVLLALIAGGVAISRPAAPVMADMPEPEPLTAVAQVEAPPAPQPVFAANPAPVTVAAPAALSEPTVELVWEMPQDPPNPRIRASYNRRRLLAIRQAMEMQSGGAASAGMGSGALPAGGGPQGPLSSATANLVTANAGLAVPSDAVPSGPGYERWKRGVIAAIARRIRSTGDAGELQNIQVSMLSLPRRESDSDFDRRLSYLDKAIAAKMQSDGMTQSVPSGQRTRLSEQNIRLAIS